MTSDRFSTVLGADRGAGVLRQRDEEAALAGTYGPQWRLVRAYLHAFAQAAAAAGDVDALYAPAEAAVERTASRPDVQQHIMTIAGTPDGRVRMAAVVAALDDIAEGSSASLLAAMALTAAGTRPPDTVRVALAPMNALLAAHGVTLPELALAEPAL